MELVPRLFFAEGFERLTSNKPYLWQTKLFEDVINGDWPEVIPLPTGAGKTSVLYVWLLALVWSLRHGGTGVPRRLAWVVNRRVVVDQVTEEIRGLIDGPESGLARCTDLRDVLRAASASGEPLAVSTLRGERADNGDWRRDPSAPAIVVGTVDMIGSRLLFRGYGSGPYYRPIQAGLLGVDTLLVNDEAHLSHAFARLLAAIKMYGPAAQLPGKSFRVMLLSATPETSELRTLATDPEAEAAEDEHFGRIFHAPKALTLHEVESKAVEGTMWKLATEGPAARTAVFIEQPEKAAKFAQRLADTGARVALLTGTLRGLERDRLVEHPVFRAFLSPEGPIEPVYLVTTSAGEVGVNLTCERMISGLVPADSVLQRMGRLNRFGGETGEAHIVFATPKAERLIRTVEYLRSLAGDVSVRSVWLHPAPPDATSGRPAVARMEERLVEAWALTTYRDREMQSVEPWLHGKEEASLPEMDVAWRADVNLLLKWDVSQEQVTEVLKKYPIRSHERVREPVLRITEKMNTIAGKAGAAEAAHKFFLVDRDGTVERITFTQFAAERDLANKLLLLPEGLGTVDARGMFQPELVEAETAVTDVADESTARRRYRIDDDGWSRIGKQGEVVERDASRSALAEFAALNGLRAPFVVKNPSGEVEEWLAYFGAAPPARAPGREVLLDAHQCAVAEKAAEMASRAGLSGFVEVFRQAGLKHDEGKRDAVWQKAMAGSSEKVFAKVKAPANLRLLNGYRHEFGSLLRVDDAEDLILHLIASHHDGARPFFESRQYDRNQLARSREAALEAVRRFARLQANWGPWGLAYLEAVFKCADGLVSREEGGQASG